MKPQRPLVSIVVNNRDYGHFLGEAIDSALSQDYSAVEVVVVDDGSRDDSRSIIHRYGDALRPVLKENGGQASAFNAGLRACHGEIVIFLDADDALLSDAAGIAVDSFEERVSKVCWPLIEMDALGSELGSLIPRAPLPEGELRDLILREGPNAIPEVPTSGNAWSRRFLDRVLPMPEAQFRINADSYLSTLAPVYGALRALSAPHSRYRVHGQNRYVLGTVEEKNQRQLELYRLRCELTADHFRRIGSPVDSAAWLDGNWHYEYLKRVGITTREILSLVPDGGTFILMDDGLWGDGRAETPAVPGRIALPFLERDGAYNGRPLDDESAIRELERLRRERHPTFVVIVWLAFWWLESYSGLADHLRQSFRCVAENDRLVAFDLRT